MVMQFQNSLLPVHPDYRTSPNFFSIHRQSVPGRLQTIWFNKVSVIQQHEIKIGSTILDIDTFREFHESFLIPSFFIRMQY